MLYYFLKIEFNNLFAKLHSPRLFSSRQEFDL